MLAISFYCLLTSIKQLIRTTESWRQRSVGIREWFGLEGSFKPYLAQLVSYRQEYLPPDQVAQSSI